MNECSRRTRLVIDNVSPSFPYLVLVFTFIIARKRTMSTMQSPKPISYPSDSYFVGSYNSATETDSDVPGPGRLLGKAYDFLGKKAENGISRAAITLGLGPRATARRIRRIITEDVLVKPCNEKRLKKAGKQLLKYIR